MLRLLLPNAEYDAVFNMDSGLPDVEEVWVEVYPCKVSPANKGCAGSQEQKNAASEANSKPCTFDGVQYKSRKEASEKIGVSLKTIDNWLKGGKRKGNPVTIEGVTYPSIKVAARVLGVSQQTIGRRYLSRYAHK